MKKLVLILAALVAVVAFAMPLFATENIEISGELTFGMITAFDSEKDGGGFDNAYIDIFLRPDEYNEVFLEFGWAKAWDYSYLAGAEKAVNVNYFSLRTDMGAFFGLPVGLVTTAGVDSLYTNKYEVSGHAYERTLIRSDIDPVPWKAAIDGGSWQLTAALGWGQTDAAAAEEKGSKNDLGLYLFIPAVGPAEIEAWYLAENDPNWKGRLGVSAKADGLMGGLFGVAGGFVYSLVDDSGGPGDNFWGWGAGVGFDYMSGALGVSVNGNNTDTLYQLGVDLDYAYGDFGVIAAAGFDFSDAAADTFAGLDVGVYTKPGVGKWQVGYLYRPEGSGYAYSWTPAGFYGAAPAAAPDGGLYFMVDIDF